MTHGFRVPILGLALLASMPGCVGGADNQPTKNGASYSQPSDHAAEPTVAVEMVINKAPRITSMLSSTGRVDHDVPVTLYVSASDADGDKLSFLWKSSCAGMFDRTDTAQTTFIANALPAEAEACAFDVVVGDGHGGDAQGTLTLSAVPPKINVGPAIGPVAQSTDLAATDEVVVLHAAGLGRALTWTWKASAGSLSDQIDTGDTSDVRWQTPATPGARCTITVTATDLDGASASYELTVRVSE